MTEQAPTPNSKLSLLFTENGFSYLSDYQGTTTYEVISISATSALEYLEKLDVYLTHRGIETKNYSQTEVVFQSNLYTLVPNELFDESQVGNYLKLNAPLSSTDPIRYNIDLDRKFVTVFSYPEDIEFYLEKKFKNLTYFHSLYVFIQNIRPKEDSLGFHVNLHDKNFDLVVYKDTRLVHAKLYHFSSKEDILYHLLNYCTQFNYDPGQVNLLLYGSVSAKDENYRFLEPYFKTLHLGMENSTDRSRVSLIHNPVVS